MRRLPLVLLAVLLSACSLSPKPAVIPPVPTVETGAVLPRDVSEDGLKGPATATAAVLVINKGDIGSGNLLPTGSGMVMWSSSSLSSAMSSLGSGVMVSSAMSASGRVVTAASGTMMSSSSLSLSSASSSAMVLPPRTSSSSVSSAMSSVPAALTGSTMVQGDSGILAPSTVPSAGVQPRRVANNLVLSIETDFAAIPPGGMVQLAIPVRNFSTGPAEGFLVEVTVPEGVTITDAVLGEIDGRNARWRFNQLLPDQMYTLHLAARAPRTLGSDAILPFSARVSGGNLAGNAVVTTTVMMQKNLPQTGVDLSANLLSQASSTASNGERTILLVVGLTCMALLAGLITGRVLHSQKV